MKILNSSVTFYGFKKCILRILSIYKFKHRTCKQSKKYPQFQNNLMKHLNVI